mgnify:CR=1 FL=1|jgi:Transposase and inactivated derivatives
MHYRRALQKGGRYFFTLVTHDRKPIFNHPETVFLLRNTFKRVKRNYPFDIDAAVILPDHLHCIWTLPCHDDDFSTRWRLIKSGFAKAYGHPLPLWQNRFWEHLIRDEQDYRQHLDYIHFNPVKHGYVQSPGQWPYSSFHRFAALGFYDEGWGRSVELPDSVGNE